MTAYPCNWAAWQVGAVRCGHLRLPVAGRPTLNAAVEGRPVGQAHVWDRHMCGTGTCVPPGWGSRSGGWEVQGGPLRLLPPPAAQALQSACSDTAAAAALPLPDHFMRLFFAASLCLDLQLSGEALQHLQVQGGGGRCGAGGGGEAL